MWNRLVMKSGSRSRGNGPIDDPQVGNSLRVAQVPGHDGRIELVTASFAFYPPYERVARITLWEHKK